MVHRASLLCDFCALCSEINGRRFFHHRDEPAAVLGLSRRINRNRVIASKLGPMTNPIMASFSWAATSKTKDSTDDPSRGSAGLSDKIARAQHQSETAIRDSYSALLLLL